MRLASVLAVAVYIGANAAEAPAGPGFDPAAIYDVPIDGAPRRGPDDALVTIVEFSDFACGYCNRAQAVLRHVERTYPGQIRWVFRPMPLDDEGTLASEAAMAAAMQGRFWPMHDRLFAVRGRVDRAAVELYAAELGLDLVAFRGALDSGDARAAVDRELAVGRRLGIAGTPAFFVNGRAIAGARPLSTFLIVLAEELARAREAGAPGYAASIAGGRASADSADETPAPWAELSATRTYRVGLGLPGHRVGPDDAAVTIAVWSDFACPYCAQQAPVLERLRREHPRDVRVVYRHYPLPGHANADLAAEAAVEAGRQGKFWAFHDAMFAPGAVPITRAVILERAQRAGLDVAAIAAVLDDRRHRDAVLADQAAAMSLGAGSTPTLFVNGVAVAGMTDHAELSVMVQAGIAHGRELVARGVPAADVYGVIGRGADATEVGDPRQLARSLRIEPGTIERVTMILAACRAGDRDEAIALAARLRAPELGAVRATCGDRGVDLP